MERFTWISRDALLTVRRINLVSVPRDINANRAGLISLLVGILYA